MDKSDFDKEINNIFNTALDIDPHEELLYSIKVAEEDRHTAVIAAMIKKYKEENERL